MTEGDQIKVGNISNATGVAIGAGARATVYQGLSVEEVAALVVELKDKDQPLVWDGRLPYPGLNAFQESDAQFFFGREELVDDLLRRVQENRFVVIAGPSGSGKSSLARAGLFHALRQGRLERSEKWVLATMSPKDKPVENLALAIGRDGGDRAAAQAIREDGGNNPLLLHEQVELLEAMSDDRQRRFVLLVDQFEEIFTQTVDQEAREKFIRLLTRAAAQENGRTTIILSLRSDFVSNCALYPDLRAQINRKNQFQLVGAMEARDLAKAISLPALEVGVEIEPALVKQIIDDMKGEPGALPLMSFALRDLFLAEKTEMGAPMDLTRPEYVARGGIDRALERHANHVFESFTAEQQELAKGIFSKLITVGEGRVDTRRTAVFEELVPADADEEAVAAVVGKLAAEGVRLVTTSSVEGDEAMTAEGMAAAQTTVTLAHEKLIDAWPWLRQLVDENRDIIALQNEINSRAHSWAREEDAGYLYRGGLLLQVEENWQALQPNLDELSLRFIQASIAERQAEVQAEADRIRQQEALRQEQANAGRFRRLTKWLAVAAAVAAFATLVALFFMNTARNQADEVAELKIAIQASQLAEASRAELGQDQELALLLATTGFGLKRRSDTFAPFYSAIFAPYRHTLNGHTDSVRSASFSPDGQTIVTASSDGSAKLWDAAGNELASLDGHTGSVLSASFSPDGQTIVTASDGGSAKLWDVAGNELASLDGHTGSVLSASFSPDGQTIVTASLDGSAKVWDVAGNELASLDGHTDGVWSASFSPDGQTIVTASSDGSAKVWDVAGNEIASLDGHADFVRSANFSPDGQTIVTASFGGSAKLWDVAGKELASLEGHTGSVLSAGFSPDGQTIVTASFDGSAKLWDVAGNELASLDGHTDGVWSASFSPDGQTIVTASEDRSAKVWDVAGNEIASLDGHQGGVNSAGFSPDGQTIVTASRDGSAKLWAVAGNEIASLDGHTDWVYSASFSPDGRTIVTASLDGSAKVWDVAGNELASLDGHQEWVLSAGFSPDGQTIVTASSDGSAKLWDVAGNEIASLDGHTDGVWSAGFSPDGQTIVTASSDGSAKLWAVAGNELASLDGHQGSVLSASFSPDGQTIVTASLDGSAKVWDVAGNELASLDGHTDGVWSAGFSPDGQTIVTASDDRSAKVWDVAGNELASLDGHTHWVRSASFSPDGQTIVTASSDGSAKLWAYPPWEKLVVTARQRLVDGFSDEECRRFFREDPESCPQTVEAVFALFEDDLQEPSND